MPDQDSELRKAAAELAAGARGPHPAAEILAAYQDGELSAAEGEQVRDHLAVCRTCADQVLVSFGDEFAPRAQPPAASARVAYGLAAGLLLAVFGLGLWGLGQHAEIAELKAVAAGRAAALAELRRVVADGLDATGVYLAPLRSAAQLRDAAPTAQVVAPPSGIRGVVYVLAVGEEAAAPAYRVEIRPQGGGSGEVVWSAEGLRRAVDGTVSFELPTALLPTGDYTLRLVAGGGSVGLYPFRYAPAP